VDRKKTSSNSEQMKEYKDIVGDRSVVASVSKFGEEKVRGVKM
jgi:hypothetical protein